MGCASSQEQAGPASTARSAEQPPPPPAAREPRITEIRAQHGEQSGESREMPPTHSQMTADHSKENPFRRHQEQHHRGQQGPLIKSAAASVKDHAASSSSHQQPTAVLTRHALDALLLSEHNWIDEWHRGVVPPTDMPANDGELH